MFVLLHRICRAPAQADPEAAGALAVGEPVLELAPAAPAIAAPPAPRPVRWRRGAAQRPGLGALVPVGIGLAGFAVALGIHSLVATRET